MNDKCAADIGKYAGVSIIDLAEMALVGEDINSICTVFVEFEVICLIGKGTSRV